MKVDQYLVKPGQIIDLDDWNPDDTSGFDGDKDDSEDELDDLVDRLDDLQDVLYAEHKHAILIILQGTDTAGKDGATEHIFEGVNPQGVHVVSFKAPTQEELDHDFLWRIHKHTPAKGQIAIFNRSQYEDVLIVRVHNLVPPEVWGKRYQEINNFEKMLAENGTTIMKFFLHISKKEQKERLEDRLKEPDKHWKFNPDDLKERALWDEYQDAYEAVLTKTSTEWAPWMIVPANHKWYRNLVISKRIDEVLSGLNMKYPQPEWDAKDYKVE